MLFSSAIKCASSIRMLCEFVSKLPPSCGLVSATTSVKPPALDIRFATEIFLFAEASASCNNNTSFVVSTPLVIAVCPVIAVAASSAAATASSANFAFVIASSAIFAVVTLLSAM